MHILQTVSSTEIPYSGVTYCVNELSQGLNNLGQNVEVLSLSSTRKISVVSNVEHKFRNNFLNFPFLEKIGYSSNMKEYVLSHNADILHTHGLWMLPNIYRNKRAKFVISPHGMLTKNALKFSQTKISRLVPMKHLKASLTLQTIGSPLILNEVLTNIGQPVISLNFFKSL